jgi:hypothetical protein
MIKLLARGRHCDDADEYLLSSALLFNLAAIFCTELQLAMPTPISSYLADGSSLAACELDCRANGDH